MFSMGECAVGDSAGDFAMEFAVEFTEESAVKFAVEFAADSYLLCWSDFFKFLFNGSSL